MALLERWQPVDLRSDPDEAAYLGDPGELVDATGFVAELLHRPAWHAQAACRGQGVTAWFPRQGDDVRPAKAICAGCAVLVECSGAGLYERHGIWAGTSSRQRKRLRVGQVGVEDRNLSPARGHQPKRGRPRCVDCGSPCTRTRCLGCHNEWALAQMPPSAA